jgi:hypothetical protein
MHKQFTYNKTIARKINGKKVSKRISAHDLEAIHKDIATSLDIARINLKNAVMQALYVIEVNAKEDDVEKIIDIMIQRPDKYAKDLFAFAISVDKMIHKK